MSYKIPVLAYQPKTHHWIPGRAALGSEYHHYPSLLAQRFWYYVMSIGKSRTPFGFRHHHVDENGFLLHYVRRGEIWHRVRERILRGKAGQVCLFDMAEAIEYGNDRPQSADNWWLLFNGRDLSHMFTELRADRNPIFDSLDTRRLEEGFDRLFILTKHKPPAYEAEAAALLMEILAVLFASRIRSGKLFPLVGKKNVLSESVRRGLDYITRFYAEPMTLKTIADVAGQNMVSFARLFQHEMEIPPIRYLNRHRIEEAKQLLTDSDKPVRQIAQMVGVPNPIYFSRLFGKITGLTPLDYRKREIARHTKAWKHGA